MSKAGSTEALSAAYPSWPLTLEKHDLEMAFRLLMDTGVLTFLKEEIDTFDIKNDILFPFWARASFASRALSTE